MYVRVDSALRHRLNKLPFCSLLFRSEEHVGVWYRGQGIPKGTTLIPGAAGELARIWYADRMSPDWRRRIAEEAEAVFARLGLARDF